MAPTISGFAAAEGVGSAQTTSIQVSVPLEFPARSDRELNALLATKWDVLDPHQRAELLSEVKLRMARHKGRDRVIHLQMQRRYGRRVIRQRDGSLVRIQTQVVRVRPTANGKRSYGVGFEERSKEEPATAPETLPVMTVNDPVP